MATERIDIVVSQRGAKEVRRDIEGIGDGAKTASTSVGFLKNALKLIGIGTIASETAKLSDAYTTITNRLKIATRTSGELAAVQQNLFDISQRTRTEFTTNVQLYNRLAIASKELGASQATLLQFTEAVGNALSIGGGTVESTRGALIQLSQAVGTTIVRAEEFNSILEGAPRIAQAAAAGLDKAGGSVARLRQLIVTGKVTSKEFFDAILSQAPKLAEEFSRTNSTIAQSFVRLNNALIQFTGQNIGGAAGAFAKAINVLADNVNLLGTAFIFLATVIATRYLVVAVRAIAVSVELSLAQAAAARQAALTSAGMLGMGTAAAAAATEVTFLSRALGFFGGPIGAVVSLLAGAFALLALRTSEADKATEAYNQQAGEALTLSGKLLFAKGKELEKLTEQKNKILETAKANVELARTALLAAEAQAKQLNINNAFLVAKAGFIPGQDAPLASEQARIDEARKNLEIQQKRLEDLTAQFDTSAFKVDIPQVDLSGGKGGKKSKAELIALENAKLSDQIRLLGLSAQARETETKLVEFEQQLREKGYALTETERQQLRDKISSYVLLNEQVQQQEQLFNSIRGPQKDYVDGLAAAQRLLEKGAITTSEYSKTVRDLRIAYLDTATDISSGFERGLLKVQKQFEDTGTLAENVVTDMAKNLEDSLVEFVKTGKLSFKSLIDSMIEDIIRLQARQALNSIFGSALGGAAGGSGGGGILGSLISAGVSYLSGGAGGFFGGDTVAAAPIQGLGQISVTDLPPLPGFATGSSFTVPGSGGVDSQNVSFRASPGERVTVGRKGEDSGRKGDTFVFNITTPSPESFAQSQSQVAANAARAIARSRRNT